MIHPKLNLKQGKNCQLSPDSYFGYSENGKGQIILGNNVRIRHNCVIRTCGGTISIGDGSVVNYNSIMHGMGNITIGKGVLISPGVDLFAQNHGIARNQPISKQKQTGIGIIIDDDVWIGAGSIILDGVTIGNGAVVGAGCVVTKDIQEYEIWVGNPGKKIGERK